MFTFDKDIYKSIMKPIGLQYFVNSNEAKPLSSYSPHNQRSVWSFLYPVCIVDKMAIEADDVFSSISKGSFKRVPISTKENLKLALKGNNPYLHEIYEHLCKIIEDNASIEAFTKVEGVSQKSLSIGRNKIDAFRKTHISEINDKRQIFIQLLSNKLASISDEILSDLRFDSEFGDFIAELINQEPIRVLGILCVFALFDEKEDDALFLDDLKFQFRNGNDIGQKNNLPSQMLKSLPHELTDTVVINATKSSVLYREKEYNAVLNCIHSSDSRGVVLSGMGGSGKTSIARLAYCDLKKEFDCCGWINYSGDLKQSMISSLNIDDKADKNLTENDIQKEWNHISRVLSNNKQSKLIVLDNVDYIDGIQSPISDKELSALSAWDNIKVIITTRLPKMRGYDSTVVVENLGDDTGCEKCIELFYHYNSESEKYRDSNYCIVEKICKFASYNTMVIELLAKGSTYYYQSLDEFYNELIRNDGFNSVDEVTIESDHDYNKVKVKNDDGTINKEYYDIGNETAVTQLIKLFNLKMRNETERRILWDFHCLPEAEKISMDEFKLWLGYSIRDINSLKEEGWVKYEDGWFFIHPLIRQVISCTPYDLEKHWKIEYEKSPLVAMLRNKTFFDSEDGMTLSSRKLLFVDCITDNGRLLEADELIYLADNARKRGFRKSANGYYKLAYDRLYDKVDLVKLNVIDKNNLPVVKQFWHSAYFYGYMLSYTKSGYDSAELYMNPKAV